MKTRLPKYLFLAACFTSCFFISACENDIRKIDDLMKKKTAVEEGTGVTAYLSQQGIMKAKLTAPYMLRHQADSAYIEYPRTVHVDFYNDTTKAIESILDARYARYREFEKKVFLKDSVVVINIAKGDTLRTDELWWDQEKEEFYTDKPVRIYEPDKTIYGKGLRAAQNFDWYDIFHISGQVLTNPDALP
jgi:LPS export ABC transporter protein LptC